MPSRERALQLLPSDRRYALAEGAKHTVEGARREFVRGNIDVFELERRVAKALEREPTDKVMLESTPEKESTMVAVRRVGGIIALGTAAFIALFMIAIVAFGIGGLIVHLLSM